MKIATGFLQVILVVFIVAVQASHAQTIQLKPGTFVDRTSEGLTGGADANQAVQAARAANDEANSREQARLDAVRASVARETSLKESQRAAANLELERQMEKARQETYQYYRNTGEAYYERVRQRPPTKRDVNSTAQVEKRDVSRRGEHPGCDIRPVMTDAEIEALRRCR